jgi:SAM-dependent methyltransferase
MKSIEYELGCRLPINDWVWLNREGVFQTPSLRQYVSPFPPVELMHNVSGLQNESDFASHGADFFLALSVASPIALTEYRRILDFGCGCGRLTRMFKGHPSRISACDVDGRHVKWVDQNLSYVEVRQTSVYPPLPYDDNEFDAIVSISVFTHLGEKSQDEFLAELHRISSRTGFLFLTVHGACALKRALNEPQILAMIAVDERLFQAARYAFAEGQHAFILQQGHLTSSRKTLLRRFFSRITGQCVIDEPFEYGITFIPESYIRQRWAKWFDVVDYRSGAIHSFQDIVVLRPRK